jgi:hypothetical protein
MGLPLSKILCEQWAVLDQVCGRGRWTGGPVKILCDVDALIGATNQHLPPFQINAVG